MLFKRSNSGNDIIVAPLLGVIKQEVEMSKVNETHGMEVGTLHEYQT